MNKEVRASVIIVSLAHLLFLVYLEITADNGAVIELKSDITEVCVLIMYWRLINNFDQFCLVLHQILILACHNEI